MADYSWFNKRRQRGVQCSVRHVDERIEQLHGDIGDVCINQRRCKTVVEAQDGKARERYADV